MLILRYAQRRSNKPYTTDIPNNLGANATSHGRVTDFKHLEEHNLHQSIELCNGKRIGNGLKIEITGLTICSRWAC